MTRETTTTVTDLVPGTWSIDPVHSEVGFVARHLVVSKVRGKFTRFEGTITIAEDPLSSTAQASIDAASIFSGDDTRDAHLRSADFLDVEKYPKLAFASRSLRPEGDRYVLSGDLTIRDVTRQVDLVVELNGVAPDPYGGTRAGFSAATEINRRDFGLAWNAAVEGGGLVVGEKVAIEIEIEAILKKD